MYNRYYEKIGNEEPKCIDDELPFEIPDSWRWVRLPDIAKFNLGKTPDRGIKKYWSNGTYNWFSIADMQDKATVFESKERISKIALEEKFDGQLCARGTLMMSFKLTVGRTSILGTDAIHNEAIISIIPYYSKNNTIRNFLLNTLGLLVNYVNKTDAVKGNTLNSSKLKSMFIPLPPFIEQQRIIDCIERLYEYVNIIETNQTELEQLYDDLKKKTLDLAIRGRLVPQDPKDEPASELLKRIRAEKKTKLGKKYVESYIYKGDDNCYYEHISGIAIDEPIETPFEIPDSWCWARWRNISESIQYGYNAPAKKSGRIKMVRISDIHDNEVDWNNVPYCDITEKDIPAYLLEKGDILFARTGGTVGKSYLVNSVPEEAIYAGYLIRTRYSKELSSQYLKYFMESNLYWMQLRYGTIATAQPNCNGQTLSKMILPIPPFTEQQRIVNKINEIFAKL